MCLGKILAGGLAAASRSPSAGRRAVGKDQIGIFNTCTVRREGGGKVDLVSPHAVQGKVHQQQAVCVRDVLNALNSAIDLELLVLGVKVEIIVRCLADKGVGGDQEAACARCRVRDDLPRLWLHQPRHHGDQWAWGKVLPRAAFGFLGVLLQQAFVEVAEAVAFVGEPVQFVNGGDQRVEVLGFPDEGAGVVEDGRDGARLPLYRCWRAGR